MKSDTQHCTALHSDTLFLVINNIKSHTTDTLCVNTK